MENCSDRASRGGRVEFAVFPRAVHMTASRRASSDVRSFQAQARRKPAPSGRTAARSVRTVDAGEPPLPRRAEPPPASLEPPAPGGRRCPRPARPPKRPRWTPRGDAAPARDAPGASASRPASDCRATSSSARSPGVFRRRVLDDEALDELETALLTADVGVDATRHLLDDLRARYRRAGARCRSAGAAARRVGRPRPPARSAVDDRPPRGRSSSCSPASTAPARRRRSASSRSGCSSAGLTVLLAAGDTFRAAAREQLVGLGRAQQRAGDPAGGRRPGGGHVRRRRRRQRAAASTSCWRTRRAGCRRRRT